MDNRIYVLFVQFFGTAEIWESIIKVGLRLRGAKRCIIKICASKIVDIRGSNTVLDGMGIFYTNR